MTTTADALADVIDKLRSAEELIGAVELSAIATTDLPSVTASLRRLEARCSGLGVAIAGRARASGDDASAVLLGRGRVSGRRARQEVERAAVADRMPALGSALSGGEVSGEHLDAVARVGKGLSPDEAELFDELGPELADAAAKLPVDTFARKLRSLVDERRADHGLTRLQQQRARSSLKMWVDPDGMGHLHVTADPERFAEIQTAIEAETASLAAAAKADGAVVSKNPALQLDALVELLGKAQGRLGRAAITVIVDQATLTSGPHEHSVCETEAGVDLPITVVERHACDSTIQIVTVDDNGLPLDVGRKYRTATAAQWVALRAMYATCAWDGCDRPITWTQAHHIREWEHGGPTDLRNLVPLCTRHHHMVHDDGWRLRLRADRTLEIHRPDRNHASSTRPSGEAPPPDERSLWATTQPDRQPPRAPRAADDHEGPPGRRRTDHHPPNRRTPRSRPSAQPLLTGIGAGASAGRP